MGFEFFGQEEDQIDKSQSLYSSFAKMEVRNKEYDRARVIYKVRAFNLSIESTKLTKFNLANSSLSIDYPVPVQLNSTPPTLTSRNSLVIVQELKRLFLGNVVSNTKKS